MLTARKILVVLFVTLLSLTFTKQSFAYGGGGGLSSGLVPTPDVKIVCEYKTKTFRLPYNQNYEVKLPSCKMEIKNNEKPNDFDERVDSFFERLTKGKK